jgi:hypothetical protein
MTLPLDDLIHELAAPPNRRGKHTGEFEHHFYEGAVMVAYAMHLLHTEATNEVSIHPDGTHDKQFDFKCWLMAQRVGRISRRRNPPPLGMKMADYAALIRPTC